MNTSDVPNIDIVETDMSKLSERLDNADYNAVYTAMMRAVANAYARGLNDWRKQP